MASPNTIKMQRNRVLSRFLSMKVIPSEGAGPNHAERRASVQRWCKKFGVSYADARNAIKEEEAKMRARGIDPWAKPKPFLHDGGIIIR